jgi:uncharacterized membrane protein
LWCGQRTGRALFQHWPGTGGPDWYDWATPLSLLVWLRDWVPFIDDYLPEIMVSITGIALLFSLWLTGLELFVIHAFCRYCVVSAVIILIMFVLAVSYLRKVTRET